MTETNTTLKIPSDVARVITAFAALQVPPTTLEALVEASGVANSYNQAIQSEVRVQVEAKTVGADVKALLVNDFNPVYNVIWGAYSAAKQAGDLSAKFVPDSILTGIEARASKLIGPAAPIQAVGPSA